MSVRRSETEVNESMYPLRSDFNYWTLELMRLRPQEKSYVSLLVDYYNRRIRLLGLEQAAYLRYTCTESSNAILQVLKDSLQALKKSSNQASSFVCASQHISANRSLASLISSAIRAFYALQCSSTFLRCISSSSHHLRI